MGKPSLSLDELLIYAVYEVLNSGEECTFERLVYECFTRFPEAFGLRRYPEWPDSARVNKGWLRCRTDRGWIVGSVQEGFRLTSSGERVAKKVIAQLEAGVVPAQPGGNVGRTRERDEALLRAIRNDPLFQNFARAQGDFQPSEMEFRRLLGATLETPVRILRQNLGAYRNAAAVYGDGQVLDFLRACETIMAPLINSGAMGRKPNERTGRGRNPPATH